MLPLKTFKNNSSTWKTHVNLKLQPSKSEIPYHEQYPLRFLTIFVQLSCFLHGFNTPRPQIREFQNGFCHLRFDLTSPATSCHRQALLLRESNGARGTRRPTESCLAFPTKKIFDPSRFQPKWMIYNGEPYFLMDDLGGTPIFGNIQVGFNQKNFDLNSHRIHINGIFGLHEWLIFYGKM